VVHAVDARTKAIVGLVLSKAAVAVPAAEQDDIAVCGVLVVIQDMFRKTPVFGAAGEVLGTLRRGTLEDGSGRCLVRTQPASREPSVSAPAAAIQIRKPRWSHLVETRLHVDGAVVASVVGRSRRYGTVVDGDGVELGRVHESTTWSKRLVGWRIPTGALVLGWARFRVVEIAEGHDLLLRFLAMTAQLYDGSEGAASAKVERTVVIERGD
jgi:hypothetical protein